MPARSSLAIAKRPLWKPPTAGLRVDWSHPLNRGLFSCFMFTEVGDRSVRDLAAPGLTGTLESTNAWKTSRVGPMLVDTGIVNATNTFSSNPQTTSAAISFEALYYHGASVASFAALVSASAGAYGFYISANQSLIDNCTGGSTTTFTVGTIYHIVMTWDGAAGKYYTNGEADGVVTAGTPSFGSPAVFSQWLGDGAGDAPGGIGMAWFRLWGRALTAGEVAELYSAPFAPLIVPSERVRTFAILGGTVASGSVAITGTAFGVGTSTTLSLTVTKALTLESDGTGAATTLSLTVTKALTLEADGVGTATTLSLTVTKAIAGEADGVGTATTLSLTVTKALTLEADGTGSATTLALTVTKAIAGQTSGTGTATTLTLTVTKAIAGESDGVGTATTLTLTVGAGGVSITGTASGTGAATALTLTVSVAITGQASGTGTATALTLTISVAIAGTAQGSGAGTAFTLTVGVVITATRIVLTDAPLWSTILTDAPLWSTALSDAAQNATGLVDAGQNATTLSDAPTAQTVLVDA